MDVDRYPYETADHIGQEI